MSEAIKRILDAVTDKVLSYRPVDKGLAAKKTKRKLARSMTAPCPCCAEGFATRYNGDCPACGSTNAQQCAAQSRKAKRDD